MAKTLSVFGASGLVGSHIVKAALSKGYTVNGTMRDTNTAEKVKYLKRLENSENLKLFSADMQNSNDLDLPLLNADAAFIACLIPTYFGKSGKAAKDMNFQEGIREIIKPTVDGCLNILKAAERNGIKTVIVCSSTSSTNPVPPVPFKNEIEHWSDDLEQCRSKKFTSAAKTVMEKEAIKFANENDIRLSILLPTGLFGEGLLPTHMEHNPFKWLKSVIEDGDPRHDVMPNDSSSMIHLEDLANMFLAAYENPAAAGRYFGVYNSLHWQDIYSECLKILPNMKMPKPMSGIPVPPTSFDFTRRDTLEVQIRDFPTLLLQTIEWIKSEPF
ncbi:MAG: dihydroflavonol 4-reductase [Rhodospirillaceae bacterium]|nr:dihydroflavonol 4-reductase [Rhodospirillaceae bacterium]